MQLTEKEIQNRWTKRKKILKENGWEYSREYEAWFSPDAGINFVYDLKHFTDDEFSKYITE